VVPGSWVLSVKVPDLLSVAEKSSVEEGVRDDHHPQDNEHVERLAEDELPKVPVVSMKCAPAR
jgi:hypothetical protein